MLEVKKIENKNHPGEKGSWWARAECPACGYNCYASGLKVHIIAKAKSEALEIACGDRAETNHLDLYREHRIKQDVKAHSMLISFK